MGMPLSVSVPCSTDGQEKGSALRDRRNGPGSLQRDYSTG